MRRACVLVVAGLQLCPSGWALVLDQPCCQNMLHVPAAFGPDLLAVNPPIRAYQLVVVEPPDACDELKNPDLRGKVALVRRGDCNFTDKIFRVQQREAVAAIVYDNHDRERWGTIMSGVEDWVARITIPSVFVSYATGVLLRNASGSGTEVLVTLNSTGHVKPKTKQIGPIETLATYVVVSLVLLSFSGCCGLLLMLFCTCYQRAFRRRALLMLRTQTFKRPVRTLMAHRLAEVEGLAPARGGPAAMDSGMEPAGGAESSGANGAAEVTEGGMSTSAAAATNARNGSRLSSVSIKLGLRVMMAVVTEGGLGGQCWRRRGRGMGGEEEGSCGGRKKGGGDGSSSSGVNGKGGKGRSGGSSGAEWEEEDRTCCAICLEDYEDGDVLRLLPCGHGFHDVCIKPWLLEKSEACPMCKRPAFRQVIHSSQSNVASSSSLLPASATTGAAALRPRHGAVHGAVQQDAQPVHHPMSLEGGMAIDEVGMYLQNNSLFAMVLVAVVTSATVVGAMAMLRSPLSW